MVDSLRSQPLRTAIHCIGNALTARAQSPPEPLAVASRQEIHDLLQLEIVALNEAIHIEHPAKVRMKILALASACAFALASIEQGEIDW